MTMSMLAKVLAPNHRLRKHNRQVAGGAGATEGQQWEILALYKGFDDLTHCLSFESILQNTTVSHYSQMVEEADRLTRMIEHQFVTKDTEHYSSSGSRSSRDRIRTPVPVL